MREYFLDLLNNLDKLAGLRQLEKIVTTNKPDDAKREINRLIDILVNVSLQFPYIPEKDQRNIISAAVVSDPEFTGLNARVVYKWLFMHREKYFQESHHKESNKPNAEPLTGEARQKRLEEWMQSLGPLGEQVDKSARVSKKREMIMGANYEPAQHPSTTVDDMLKRELHDDWIRNNFDVKTGKPLDTFVDEKEWIARKNKML